VKSDNPNIWLPSYHAVSEAIKNIQERQEKQETPERQVLIPWESIAEEEFYRV
jgi:hypothetical protein